MRSRPGDLDLLKRPRTSQPHRFARWAGGFEDGDFAARDYRIAVPIPLSGTAGIWGPSCLACATLAAEEWNAAGGVDGRRVSLAVVDASDESSGLEEELEKLVDEDGVEAVVGMQTSSVRERITAQLRGIVPFVYTPLYEGGPLPDGVMAIGETPRHQLLPAIEALGERYALRRWHLVGNDYCWPRRSHAMATEALRRAGREVVASRYVPMGSLDVQQLIDEIRQTRAQAVLMSLVGQDAVDFSRALGEAGLAGRVVRLSCAIEENGLLAIGPKHTEGLFVASAYFASLATERNAAFRERYWTRFGERAPVLNALGQSMYEGVSFLRAALKRRVRSHAPIEFDSVRSMRWRGNADASMPIYLAQAEGMSFRVLRPLSGTPA
ncbi:MAG TPA: substrate-binding domain-containing protein [Zeimonas sp.]